MFTSPLLWLNHSSRICFGNVYVSVSEGSFPQAVSTPKKAVRIRRAKWVLFSLWITLSYWKDVNRKISKAEGTSDQTFSRAVVGYMVDTGWTRYSVILLCGSSKSSRRDKNVHVSWKQSYSFPVDRKVSLVRRNSKLS